MRAVVLHGPGAIAFEEHADPTSANGQRGRGGARRRPEPGRPLAHARGASCRASRATRASVASRAASASTSSARSRRSARSRSVHWSRALARSRSPKGWATGRRSRSASPASPAGCRWSGPARWRPGESVLVLGASGAVGHIAVQAARLLGARRIVAAARDADAISAPGADETVALDRGLPARRSRTPPGTALTSSSTRSTASRWSPRSRRVRPRRAWSRWERARERPRRSRARCSTAAAS